MVSLVDGLNYPFTNKVDVSQVKIPQLHDLFTGEFGPDPYKNLDAKPEMEALDFYLSNHVVALLRTKYGMGHELGRTESKLVKMYVERTSAIALRAFTYLLLICTREIRHCNGSNTTSCKITLEEKSVYDFIRQNIGHHNGSKLARNVWDGVFDWKLGEWATVIEKIFRHGNFGGGFGGPAWADVAAPLRDYVNSTYTAEMLVDVIWTLCHNNGPIFNKGMLYECHTSELLRILDVQRAGQIPNFDWSNIITVSPWFSEYLNLAKSVLPELNAPADIAAIKATAVHSMFWQGKEYQAKGYKVIKPSTNAHPEISIQTVEIDRG